MKEELLRTSYTKEEICNREIIIREKFLKESTNINSGEIKKVSEEDLKILFRLYDTYFFNDYFKNKFKGNIKFSLSKRMNKSAGKTIVPKNIASLTEENQSFEIRIGVNFFFQYYDLKREKMVGGIRTKDSLHAFFVVFEHEIIHLLEFYIFGNSSCKNKRFKSIAFNIFGHKDVYHSLPTNSEVLSEGLNICPGDNVDFIYNGKVFKGVIYKINKRATIMVLDTKGNYVDSRGNRFSKFYVPIQLLNKL